MAKSNHKIKIGDEIQAVLTAKGSQWWIGTLKEVHPDGEITLDDAIPLYPIGASWDKTETIKSRATCVWVYLPEHASPVLTWSGTNINDILSK